MLNTSPRIAPSALITLITVGEDAGTRIPSFIRSFGTGRARTRAGPRPLEAAVPSFPPLHGDFKANVFLLAPHGGEASHPCFHHRGAFTFIFTSK